MVRQSFHHLLTSMAKLYTQTLLMDPITKLHILLTVLQMAASVSLMSVPSLVLAINTPHLRTGLEDVVPKNRSSLTTQNPSKVLVAVTARHTRMIPSPDREVVALVRRLPASWEWLLFSEFFLPFQIVFGSLWPVPTPKTMFPPLGTPHFIQKKER